MKVLEFNAITFGPAIVKLRKELGLNQQEFAKRAHVSMCSVVNYENGISLPRLDSLIDMARVLGIDEIRIDTSRAAKWK